MWSMGVSLKRFLYIELMYKHPDTHQVIERQISMRQPSLTRSVSFDDKVRFHEVSPIEVPKKSKTPWYMKYFICGLD